MKPITGRNRADLHVFNVEGIVISNASGTAFSSLGQTVAGFELVNSDGYTGYLDDAIDEFFPTDATIHPYILHFDDYSEGNFSPSNPMGFESVVSPPPYGNLVMAMGCDYDFKDYVFNLQDIQKMDFVYVIGCTYAVSSANKSQRFTPEYRVPQHNKKAASEVRVDITRNELAAGATSSEADLEISVLDMNHGVEVGEALNQMLADSSVGAIEIEIPGVLNSTFNAGTTPVSGNGRDPNDPLKFAATITNEKGAGIGTYSGLVKVTDTYSPGLNGSPLLSGMDGIERVDPLLNPLTGIFPISEFATYTTFEIDVSSSNFPPIVELLAECDAVYNGGWTILSVGPGTYDPEGNNLILYEFDFDYEGMNFDIDASNTTGESVITPPLLNDTGSIINRVFALRVTDDGIPPAAGIGTVIIDVHPENSNGKNIPLRPGSGATPTDLGVNKTTGDILVGFNDRQIWKYSADYSTGSLFLQLDNGFSADRLHLASNGYSLIWSSTTPGGNGGAGIPVRPNGTIVYPIAQGITYCAGVVELNGSWSWGSPVQDMLMKLTNWPVVGDVRWFQMTYINYDGYMGTFTSNVEGEGDFDSELTVAFDYRTNPLVYLGGEYWTLEAAPRYELELFRSYMFTYIGTTIGLDGAQSDGLDGFNDPRDMVLDANDRIYVLEVLSTGINCIKLYDKDGTAIAIFGTCGEIGGDPYAIESDEGDGEIHVLHSNGVSVFYASEIP